MPRNYNQNNPKKKKQPRPEVIKSANNQNSGVSTNENHSINKTDKADRTNKEKDMDRQKEEKKAPFWEKGQFWINLGLLAIAIYSLYVSNNHVSINYNSSFFYCLSLCIAALSQVRL